MNNLYLNLAAREFRFLMPLEQVLGVMSQPRLLVDERRVPGLIGVMRWGGQGEFIPVLDLGLLLNQDLCRDSLGTRVIVLRVAPSANSSLLIGLQAEGVICLSKSSNTAATHSGDSRRVVTEAGDTLKVIELERLLGPSGCEALAREFANGNS
jgi:chemotaxis signal transduction protein